MRARQPSINPRTQPDSGHYRHGSIPTRTPSNRNQFSYHSNISTRPAACAGGGYYKDAHDPGGNQVRQAVSDHDQHRTAFSSLSWSSRLLDKPKPQVSQRAYNSVVQLFNRHDFPIGSGVVIDPCFFRDICSIYVLTARHNIELQQIQHIYAKALQEYDESGQIIQRRLKYEKAELFVDGGGSDWAVLKFICCRFLNHPGMGHITSNVASRVFTQAARLPKQEELMSFQALNRVDFVYYTLMQQKD